MDYDVIIIGAGLSGLAAGIRTAHFGRRVCILEKHTRVGGLNSYYSLKGHTIDVGLHAITNYVPRQVKSTPLPRILRQLRLSYDDFQLRPQKISRVIFPGKELKFTNEVDFLIQEVSENFPRQIDRFIQFIHSLKAYDPPLTQEFVSSRKKLQGFFSDPLLIEMLLCPLMFYGCSWEHDMDFPQFSILFQSIFCEGFARPCGGMKNVLQLLEKKYQDHGGELRTRSKVQELIVHHDKVMEVHLADGQTLKAEKIISTIGLPETRALCSSWKGAGDNHRGKHRPGVMSFLESILILDTPPSELGFDTTIAFYNDSERFSYREPKDLFDPASGVICCPNNYQSDESMARGIIRLTHQASYRLWAELDQEGYRRQKEACLKESQTVAERFIHGLSDTVSIQDMFTPMTIERYTGRMHGAVYGTPDKVRDGRTPIENLFIAGTDQGFLGITGAMLSGMTIANLYILS
ncbi:MAG: phytoene desaturase family protein [bacterium]